jgi:hypothetical protein
MPSLVTLLPRLLAQTLLTLFIASHCQPCYPSAAAVYQMLSCVVSCCVLQCRDASRHAVLRPQDALCAVLCHAVLCLQDALCQAAVSAGIPDEVVYGDTDSHELPRLIYYIYVSLWMGVWEGGEGVGGGAWGAGECMVRLSSPCCSVWRHRQP